LIERRFCIVFPPIVVDDQIGNWGLHVDLASIDTDYSASFGKLRPRIRNSSGVYLVEFTKTLKPRYSRAYRDIALGYLFLSGTVAGAVLAEAFGIHRAVVCLVGAVSIGYWVAYLQLFIHEGAHWNLSDDKGRSDWICNVLVSWLIGMRVQTYRAIHFQHHRALGTAEDSEQSYFFPLNLVFFLKSLTGISVLQVALSRAGIAKKDAKQAVQAILVSAASHSAIVLGLALLGYWGSALAWGIGVACWFPTFGALRQLLEHRSELVPSDTRSAAAPQDAVARIFGDGIVASTFGGAGFNRHLLHHWEPTVSYTRLADLENFLSDTELRTILAGRRTTYYKTFVSLFRVH
jgi:fatty acid desaturase